MNMQVLDARRDASGGYRVDVSRGETRPVGCPRNGFPVRPMSAYLSLNELGPHGA